MDSKLYDSLRKKIRERTNQDQIRAADLFAVAEAFHRYVNESVGVEGEPCELGLLDEKGTFISGKPVMSERDTLLFALRLTFNNMDGSIALKCVVPFSVKSTFHFCTLTCVATGEAEDIVSYTFLSPGSNVQKTRALAIFSKAVTGAVGEFIAE